MNTSLFDFISGVALISLLVVIIQQLLPHPSYLAPKRISVPGGENQVTVRGYFTGNETHRYVLRMRSGQQLSVEIIPLTPGLIPILLISPPRGRFMGNSTQYMTRASRPGDYRIEVAPHPTNSEKNSGDFMLRIRAI